MQSSVFMKDTYLCTNKGTLIQHSEEDKSLEINFSSYLWPNCQVGLLYANSLNSAVTLIFTEMNSFCLEDAKPRRLRPLDLTASRSPAHKASKEPALDLLVHLPDGQHGELKWSLLWLGPRQSWAHPSSSNRQTGVMIKHIAMTKRPYSSSLCTNYSWFAVAHCWNTGTNFSCVPLLCP